MRNFDTFDIVGNYDRASSVDVKIEIMWKCPSINRRLRYICVQVTSLDKAIIIHAVQT